MYSLLCCRLYLNVDLQGHQRLREVWLCGILRSQDKWVWLDFLMHPLVSFISKWRTKKKTRHQGRNVSINQAEEVELKVTRVVTQTNMTNLIEIVTQMLKNLYLNKQYPIFICLRWLAIILAIVNLLTHLIWVKIETCL